MKGISLERQSSDFRDSIRFKLSTALLPVSKPAILRLTDLDSALGHPGINQVQVEVLETPELSPDLCLMTPEVYSYYPALRLPETDFPSLFTPLPDPRCAGKVYDQQLEAEPVTQPGLPELVTDEICKHGIKKKWCSDCQEERRKRERLTHPKDVAYVNPFDLILPILEPPLGEEFNSPFCFASGQSLYSFQIPGVRFLVEHENALLGDEMGLGKTIQAIVAARVVFRQGRAARGLILCPKSVVPDWGKALWEWAPELHVRKVRGPKEQRVSLWRSPAHLYLTTYETLRQDIDDIPRKGFDLCILDEIVKIKSPDAGVTKATRQIQAPIRWGLSGYPLENKLEELVTIFGYIKPGLLRSYHANAPRLVKDAIAPYFLRRRKLDVLKELPEKISIIRWLELTPAQREAYDRAEQQGIVALNRMGDLITIQHVWAIITKLKQICNLEPVSNESCKLEYLLDKLDEIAAQGEKALVFSQFPQKTLRFFEPMVARYNPLFYHGGLTDGQRTRMINQFEGDDDHVLMLMSVKAGGLGLNLQCANHVFHLDQWWNPATAAQAEDRVHRIGQERTVFVTTLYTADTIEERIEQILAKKRDLFDKVIDALSDEDVRQSLTEEEIYSLLPGLGRGKPTPAGQRVPAEIRTSQDLERLSPREFENLVAKLFERTGYQVRVTAASRDGGVDILAKRSGALTSESIIVQCKHYPRRTVPVSEVRALYGILRRRDDVHRAILVTSGEFSQDCYDFARGQPIDLIDGQGLLALLQKYPIDRGSLNSPLGP